MSDSTSPTQLNDIQSRESIRLLVDSFYTTVRQNDLIGPIFEEKIEDWDKHLPTMYLFWEKLLFDTGEYSGNPFEKHINLPVNNEHFTTWVKLFIQTVDHNFKGPMAEKAKILARRIASTFQLRMGITPDDMESAVPDYSRP